MSDFKTQRFLPLIIWSGIYFHLIFKMNKITIKKLRKKKKQIRIKLKQKSKNADDSFYDF